MKNEELKINKIYSADEAKSLLRIINDYIYALDTLDRYDYQKLKIEGATINELFKANYDNAMEAIYVLKDKFGSGGLLVMKKTNLSKTQSAQYIRLLEGKNYIQVLKKKQPCYMIGD